MAFHQPWQTVSEITTLWKLQVLLRLLPRESSRAFAATLVLGGVCGLVAVAFHGNLQWASIRASGLLSAVPSPFGFLGIVLLPALAAWVAGIVLVRSRLPAA
jgi:hypothetical protein